MRIKLLLLYPSTNYTGDHFNMKHQQKPCALCDGYALVPNKLCSNCYKAFGEYVKEPWMAELQNIQRQQKTISDKESVSVLPHMIDSPKVSGSYPFPKTSKDMRTRIRYDYNHEGMNVRALSEKYNLSLPTIRKVLQSIH